MLVGTNVAALRYMHKGGLIATYMISRTAGRKCIPLFITPIKSLTYPPIYPLSCLTSHRANSSLVLFRRDLFCLDSYSYTRP